MSSKRLDFLKKGDQKTFWFYFNLWIYLIVMIVTTVFCYFRLNYDRSYDVNKQQINSSHTRDT